MINLIVVFSAFNEMVMKLACEKYKINFSYSLTIRSLLMSIPYTVTGTLLIGFLFVFSYTLQKFEFPYSPVSGQGWSSIVNSFWNAIITMTTVGYGDFFATTNFGRLTAIVIMIWGAFINSLIIMSMTISAKFSSQEQNAFEDYVYLMTFKERVESGIRFIQSFLFVRCINRRSLVLRKRVLKKPGVNVKKVESKESSSGQTDSVAGTEDMNTEEWVENEKSSAMEKQAYFNQLSITKKRYWYGALRKSFVDFKNRRKEFAVDNSKLDTAKEIEFLTDRLDSFVLRCKAFAKHIDEIHELSEKIVREQDNIIVRLDLINDHLQNFDNIELEAKTSNTAVFNASEEVYEKAKFDYVSEGSRFVLIRDQTLRDSQQDRRPSHRHEVQRCRQR